MKTDTLFAGLSAFPLTPADADGVIDTDALGLLVDRVTAAGVDSIGLLGSTGSYAYLTHAERGRAVAAVVEAAAGRTPVIVGIGAVRTAWTIALARDAERLGADGVLLAPVGYLPLTDAEVARHYRDVAAVTALPLCIYSNPGTTQFTFDDDLIADLAGVPTIAGIKLPPAPGDYYGDQVRRLRTRVPAGFRLGHSGDWDAGSALLAGMDCWYSVVAGILPDQALAMTRAAQAGRREDVEKWNAAFDPLWTLFRSHGSFRLLYDIAELLGMDVGDPPLPIRRCDSSVRAEIARALQPLLSAPTG